ncbi:MAG: hypothetical protein MRJ96_10375 [Nitrospirales bacterium]|nr:hypothetical protein [Nitrospira sp.]MDR4501844.1 hypothetical protein [Nitrospirales bacterium]
MAQGADEWRNLVGTLGNVELWRLNGRASLAGPVAPGLCMGLVRVVITQAMVGDGACQNGTDQKKT